MFNLEEQSDVFVDACASDHRAHLLFLSVYGRDTSIQQLLARLHQRAAQGGVEQLTVRAASARTHDLRVLVGDPSRLDKVTGRLPKTGLLGNLVHAWIFDPALLQVDVATGTGWIADRVQASDDVQVAPRRAPRAVLEAQQVWRLVKELSPVPLLEHWALSTLAYIESCGGLVRPPCVGAVVVARVELPEAFDVWVSDRVRDGTFGESDRQAAAQLPVLAAKAA